jgi:hypothetical protein
MIILDRRRARLAPGLSRDGATVLVVGEPTRRERFNASPPFSQAKQWGQLFDRDFGRLIQTARDLGATPVRLLYRGDDRQSVILCGGPLRRAIGKGSDDADT